MTTFYAIDFDRTLGDVDGQTLQLTRFLQDRQLLAPDELTVPIHEARAAGESFNIMTYIHAKHPNRDIQSLQRDYGEYAAAHRSALLLPGARELITWLQQNNQAFGIVSYGEKQWQEFKIAAAGFAALPQLIVATREKAALFGTWLHEDVFTVPPELGGGAYGAMVLIDDHLGAFDELPRGVRGYWLSVAPGETATLPVGVQRIAALQEVIAQEATR